VSPAGDGPARESIGPAGWRIVLLASLGGTLEFYVMVGCGLLTLLASAGTSRTGGHVLGMHPAHGRDGPR